MSERMSVIRVGLLFAFAGALAAIPVGCADDAKAPPAGSSGGVGGGGGWGGVLTGPCEDGATRKCGIELEKHESIVSCYVGTQKCQAGVWGACSDGTTVTTSTSFGPSSQPQALSTPVNCLTNPCDPYCLNFNEDPDAGLAVEATTPLYTWPGGSLGAYPGGLVNKGLKEPCYSGFDCQFNTHCVHPRTSTACAHSKCQTGAALSATCKSSDSCVDMICNADPTCCSASWTQACVDKVATLCDAQCGSASNMSCAHTPCTAGAKLDSSCHPCVNIICATNPTCCSTTWDATCVNAVATACGIACAINPIVPPPEDGTCKPWLPGEKDPSCPGIDLAGGTPCTDNIPICNHGNTIAPAGIRVVHFPANSNQYPKCTPDQSHPQMYECFTTEPIKPGECSSKLQYWNGTAWVPGCHGLTGNREIMVNPGVDATTPATPKPANFAGAVAECSCQDNWTLYSGETCGPPQCSTGISKATFTKQNFIFMVDRSMSMVSQGIWDPMVAGLTAFYQAPTSANLGVAMEFFPLPNGGAFGDGCALGNCLPTPCSKPMIPLGTLTSAAAPTDAQEKKLIDAFAPAYPTGGGTPTYPALEGAIMWAAANEAATPAQDWSVVFITDGDPNGCNEDVTQITALATNGYLNSGVKTFVVGLPGSNMTTLNQIAAAGGTGSAMSVTASGMAAQLVAAFQSIAAKPASCSFDLPDAALFDKNDVTVTFTDSANVVTILPKRNDLASCGANQGWYFDNNTTPTKLNLCPATCTSAQTQAGSFISVNVGCPKQLGPTTYYFTYEGQCPPGAKPVWNFFAYDTTCPGDSSIDFDVRAATTQAGLTSATFKDLAVAQSIPTNTQVCPMSGPSPCPVDLFTTLGSPDQKLPWVELKVTLNPTSDKMQASLVNSWLVTYSCPPSE